MPYQIIRPEDIPAHVFETIARTNDGLYWLNEKRGINARMPASMKFDYMVISKPQSLAIITTSNKTNDSIQGGQNISVQTGTDVSQSVGSTDDVSNQSTSHGETVHTTDGDQTEYEAGDSDNATFPSSDGYLGLQSQPFPA